jgi:hypothetical protein
MTTLDQALDTAMKLSYEQKQMLIVLIDIGTHDEVY